MKKEVKYPKILAEMMARKENQHTLAKVLKISQPSVGRKLSGEFEWTIGEIEDLCSYFGKDYYQLFK